MDFYMLLGVDRNSSSGEVKRAYRRLARQFHPDVNPGDERAALRFREIAEGYAVLSDPDRRRRYDQVGYEPALDITPASGFEGFDFSATVHAVQQSTFGDLFAEVFRSTPQPAPDRGADLHATLALTFDEAVSGGERRVTVLRQESCHACAGTGVLPIAAAPCPNCEGSGAVRSARGHMVFARACARCQGTGALSQQACAGCGGGGRTAHSEHVPIPVPAGATDGLRLRVAGRGNAGLGGGPPGDLYVTLEVGEHPLFRREGDDVHVTVPVAIHEAALGARIDVPGLDGPTRLRVPPGAQSGQRFRLRGRGAPSPRGGERGDLVVEIRLMLPRLLDERSKELLRQFGMLNDGESVRDHFEQQWRRTAPEVRR
jgi:molecular chaperone DnaJ